MFESMRHRRTEPVKGGAEVDAFSQFGRKYNHWRPGERAAIKAKYNRRSRRLTREGLRSYDGD